MVAFFGKLLAGKVASKAAEGKGKENGSRPLNFPKIGELGSSKRNGKKSHLTGIRRIVRR